jgi:hypothetical protein
MNRRAAILIGVLTLVGPGLVNGVICRQQRLRIPGLICPGDAEWLGQRHGHGKQ